MTVKGNRPSLFSFMGCNFLGQTLSFQETVASKYNYMYMFPLITYAFVYLEKLCFKFCCICIKYLNANYSQMFFENSIKHPYLLVMYSALKTTSNDWTGERQMSMVSNFIVHLQISRDLAREREDNARNRPIISSAPDLSNLFGHDSSF